MLPGAPIALPDPGSLKELKDHAKVQRGHSALERLRFGSTAAKVVKHAPCDVLVVRADAGK